MQTGEQCPRCGNDYDPMHACHHEERFTLLDALMLIRDCLLDVESDGRPAPHKIEKLSRIIGALAKEEKRAPPYTDKQKEGFARYLAACLASGPEDEIHHVNIDKWIREVREAFDCIDVERR